MRTRNNNHGAKSKGFTLVEMLVALALLLILTAIAVTFVPSMTNQQKTVRGADQLQGWLLIAKQRAKKDGRPTGLRLQFEPGTPYVRTLQYVQRTDDSSQGTVVAAGAASASPAYVLFSGVDFYGGLPPSPFGSYSNEQVWLVQRGDYLLFEADKRPHRIIGVQPQPSTPFRADLLLLASDPPVNLTSVPPPITPPPNFTIIRSVPRLVPGEAPLRLPQDVAIDLTWSLGLPPLSAITQDRLDIMFAPSGEVTASEANSRVVLWVRDSSLDTFIEGEPVLLTLYVRTGLVAAHPPHPSGHPTLNPQGYYLYTREGRSGI